MATQRLELANGSNISEYMYTINSGHSNQTPSVSNSFFFITNNNIHPKWVKDLLSKPLNDTEISLLARGPNFAIVPLFFPTGDYTVAVEETA